jgi:hypothetical protein
MPGLDLPSQPKDSSRFIPRSIFTNSNGHVTQNLGWLNPNKSKNRGSTSIGRKLAAVARVEPVGRFFQVLQGFRLVSNPYTVMKIKQTKTCAPLTIFEFTFEHG